MKVLFLNWNSFGNEDLTAALKELGSEVILYPFSKSISFYDKAWEEKFIAFLRDKTPDYVFPLPIFPLSPRYVRQKASCTCHGYTTALMSHSTPIPCSIPVTGFFSLTKSSALLF